LRKNSLVHWAKPVEGTIFSEISKMPWRGLFACPDRSTRGWGNGKNPRQYGFDVELWTRYIVREVGEAVILSAFESGLKRRGAGVLVAGG
jgi:hypothetical protein